MSGRTFTVFLDTDQHSQSTDTDTSVSRSPSITPATSLSSVASTTEKENVHPVTGEPATSSQATSKKRKTGVLATKVHLPLDGSQNEFKEKASKPETKKRKPSSASVKDGVIARKTTKALASSRKGNKSARGSRRASPSLAKVSEDDEATHKEVRRLLETDINSRCYDLTVLPLADVTTAYDNPELEESLGSHMKFRSVKEKSAEPEIRDYFAPSLSASTSGSGSRSSGTPPGETKAFSTPERKQIYAAFTFKSPSPNSERFTTTTSTSASLETNESKTAS